MGVVMGAMRNGIGTLILAIIIALLSFVPAQAQTRQTLHSCIRPIQPGDTPQALFAAPQDFDCTRDQADYGAGDFWVLSDPLPVIPGDPRERLSVTFASAWQDATTLHILYADGRIRHVSFTSATTSPYLLLGAMIAVPLPREATRPVRILWEAHGAANMRGVVRGAHLGRHADALAVESSLGLVYGIIMGLVIGLAVYNLALWPALRQPLQPVYCLLLFFITGYALCSSGLIGQWLPWLDNNERHRWNAIMLGGVALTLVIFARHFFERKVFEGWLDRWAIVTFVLIAIPNAAFALLAPRWIRPLDTAVVVGFLVLLVFLIAVLVSAWRRRSNFLWAFAVAWGTPIILAMFRVLHALHLIEWRPWIDQSTLLSMGAEALIASLGVAYRIYLLSRERAQARAHERAARRLADTDPLTGLFNRRALLDQAIGRSGPQTLILADIDHFKRINDTLGHDEGDEVLRGFALALIDTLPPGTLAARIGGEEFALLADVDHAPEPEVLLQRLRAAAYPAGLKVTASLGLCTGMLHDEEDWRKLYREADQALFAAKNAGRDRACWAPELHGPVPSQPVVTPLSAPLLSAVTSRRTMNGREQGIGQTADHDRGDFAGVRRAGAASSHR